MRRTTLAALAAVATFGATLAAAQPAPVRRVGRVDPSVLQSEIGLSDEQASEIRRVLTQERKAAIRRHAELRIARMELGELLNAATLDEAAIVARVKALAELQAASVKARTESRLAVRRLVSAEQYQKLQQLKRRAVRARRVRPVRRPAGPEGSPSGPGVNDDVTPTNPA